MTRLAANLSFLFTELPFLDRFAAAAAAGFDEVEFMFPYEWDAQTVAQAARAAGVAVGLFNLPAGDWAAGERGLAALPGRSAEFRAGIDRALAYAAALDCRCLHAMAGLVAPDAHAAARQTLIENLRFAADAAAPHGVDILIEPINDRVDIAGYFLTTTDQALDLIAATERPNVRLQCDVYHMQVMGGDLARTIERAMPAIGRMQLADNPGRGEPGSGEINYPWLLARIDALGYRGAIGCEYRPTGETQATLAWAQPYLAGRRPS